MEISKIHAEQQEFFDSNKTKDISFRIEQLKKFRKIIKDNENELYTAIFDDFGKSKFETYGSELALIYHEIDIFLKNIKNWGKPKKVSSGLVNFPAKSYIIPEPLGVTLIIGAWNYPYLLSILPAITSIAAGNTVIIKPSELPSRTSAIMAKIINANFPTNYCQVVEGGVETTTELLEHRFDKIFFTGSNRVGKIIYQAAAKNLSPVTLELGGKSPTFVLSDCDINMTVKRIVWAKYFNAGQSCVAPDYILVDKSIEQKFIEALILKIKEFHKSNEEIDENYVRIINTEHFDRLEKLMDKNKLCYGGMMDRDKRFISPTILKDVSFDDKIMRDEIFGPILPIISFENIDEAISKVKERPKPLACYIYSKNRTTIKKILSEVSFGGGAVNDSMMHLSNSKLPFGGVGLSGIGSYHGKFGFDTFSHFKSILDKPFWFEANVKYAPYTKNKLKLIKWLLE